MLTSALTCTDYEYHDNLTAADLHPYVSAHNGTVGLGDGLVTLSNFAQTDFYRGAWQACTYGRGDCLTPKGFTAMRIDIAEGVSIDLYNLHNNGGRAEADRSARSLQADQLTAFIAGYSEGNAVIVAGDTNALYATADDAVRVLPERHGLRDVWVDMHCGGRPPDQGSAARVECLAPADPPNYSCELTEKVFYRSSALLKLTPTAYTDLTADFYDHTKAPLSEHVPLKVSFHYMVAQRLRSTDRIGAAGATNGAYFNEDRKSVV